MAIVEPTTAQNISATAPRLHSCLNSSLPPEVAEWGICMRRCDSDRACVSHGCSVRAAGGEMLYYPQRETEAQARARGVQFAWTEGCPPISDTEPSALARDLADSIAASSLGEDAELGELCRQHLLTWETLEPEEWGALRDRICNLPARTLAGLRAKAALVVGFDDDGENDPELMLNLAKNLLALG